VFHHCINIQDLKKLYRRLALRLHPDKGGSADLMMLLQESYDVALEFFKEHPLDLKKTRKMRLLFLNPMNSLRKTFIKQIPGSASLKKCSTIPKIILVLMTIF